MIPDTFIEMSDYQIYYFLEKIFESYSNILSTKGKS